MKALITLIFMSSLFRVFAQQSHENGSYHYEFDSKTQVYAYDFFKSKIFADSVFYARKGTKFNLLYKGKIFHSDSLGDMLLIEFWPYTSKDTTKSEINSRTTKSNQTYCVKKDDFETSVVKRYNSFIGGLVPNIGVISVPIKIRPRKAGVPTTVDKDLSFGTSVGASFRISRYKPSYISVIGIGAISSFNVDSLTTRGRFIEPIALAGFTYGFGVVYEYKIFQFSVVCGWDLISGMSGKDWIYNKRNWIGIGAGFQLWKRQDGPDIPK